MRINPGRAFAIAILPLLAACAGTVPKASPGTAPNPPAGRTTRAGPPPANPSMPASTAFRAPRVMNIAGVDGLIGSNADSLTRAFGTPRLDVYEGDTRKLQFSGEACVLDVYLYPLRQGAEPTATYVDARRTSDGLDVDRAACVAALKRR